MTRRSSRTTTTPSSGTSTGRWENCPLLLAFLQGVIGGFEAVPFSQDHAAVALLIKSIKDRDATLPHDLSENSSELRAVAAITVGELMANQPDGAPADEAVLAALALNRPCRRVRPPATSIFARCLPLSPRRARRCWRAPPGGGVIGATARSRSSTSSRNLPRHGRLGDNHAGRQGGDARGQRARSR